jgi:hypothetical protein
MKFYNLNKIDVKNKEFVEWKQKAEDLNKKLMLLKTREERVDFLKKNNHWKNIKNIFIDTFCKLCWYSDCSLDGTYGDMDHFRPKSRTRNLEKQTILDEGYWQLAYEYTNYRLSCEVVNRSGKSDFFPVRNGIACTNNIENEEPYLLDPCNLEDTKLIGYREGGEVVCETCNDWDCERVCASEKLYKLNEFIDSRDNIIEDVKHDFYKLKCFISEKNFSSIDIIVENISSYLSWEKAYSSIAYSYIIFLINLPENDGMQDIVMEIVKEKYLKHNN